jgi:HK97 gp10 family phage protein
VANSVTLKGFRELQNKLKHLPKEVMGEANDAVQDAGEYWAERAKQDAPTDQGLLKGSITSKETGLMKSEVVSPVSYSAYIEWGTKTKVKVPAEMQTYAMQFKGKGTGDYYDFLNSILDWVKRKGLSDVTNSYTGKKVGGEAAKENLLVLAEAIAWSIIKKGISPHPYFFIQSPFVEKQLRADIKKIISRPR